MEDIVLEGSHLSKKFKKGELYDTLRDLIPALTGRMFSKIKNKELSEREFWALDDVSFQVKRGEAMGVIGTNGAGKSTLLKILSGIMKPTSGRINVNGRLSALIEIGAGFHPDLTGRENVFLNGAILGMSRNEVKAKFDEIVHFSGLEAFIDTPVKRYSSGMYARLGFSVAAHINPDVLLVDEVLSVGDYGFQKKCSEKMGQLMSSGATIMFISHNLRAVTDLCERCILLERGKVLMMGSSEEVVRYYLDHATKSVNGSINSLVVISEVSILKDGQERSVFNAGDNIVVRVRVSAKMDSNDLGLHLYLRDNNDYQVFHVYLELIEKAGFSLQKGETREFNVQLSLHLAAGVYYLGVMVINEHDVSKMYDHKFPLGKIYIEGIDAVRCVANLYPKLLSL